MPERSAPADPLEGWLEALERRHLADLTFSETVRALRALSSCYVERRSRLPSGGALDTRGKRAAFALFYGPVHFFVVRQVIRELAAAERGISQVLDLGCGTGAAGAAWALEAGVHRIRGVDRHPWALSEASWTYRQLGMAGRIVQGDLAGGAVRATGGTGIIAAYTVNELAPPTRACLLQSLRAVRRRQARILIVEPIARRATPWWAEWAGIATEAGGRADEWRFPASLPPLQVRLARAAGLEPRELTARSLYW